MHKRLSFFVPFIHPLSDVLLFPISKTSSPRFHHGPDILVLHLRVVICPESPQAEPAPPDGSFKFQDPLPYLAAGIRAIVSDCVSKSFTSAELRTWNMLSR